MLIAIAGGKLQGVEAVYLAKKAGFQTLVIDKTPGVPATGLCDQFLEFEFTPDHPIPENCPPVDVILPALEDTQALTAIAVWADKKQIPLAFDPEAYRISCSKGISDALFKKMRLPAPLPWPECGFPIVVKPDQASGSQGVEIFHNSSEFSDRFPDRHHLGNRVIQEYVAGPSYSVEVVGTPGNYHALSVTDLHMDEIYDCKRVTAPTTLSPDQAAGFRETALAIAQKIKLTGIMDAEVVLNKNKLKLLEIDARFPSQTPLTVFWSSRINMVEMLGHLARGEDIASLVKHQDRESPKYVVVEHIDVSESRITVSGEHIMSQEGPLFLIPGFFGCDEAITSFTKGKTQWVATLIFCSSSEQKLAVKRQSCYKKVCKTFGLSFEDDMN